MNPNHDSKIVWPGARAARRRLWRITLVLFPLSLVIFALLVGDWKLNVPERTEESRRHLIEWLVILVAAIAVTFLAGLLPTVQRFSGWLFSRRVVRRMLIAFAWLVTVVVLFYAEENWRGWHAWNRYRQPLAAQGVPFDYRAFIPKPVPDDQNFAATPFVESWFLERTNFDQRWNDNFSQASRVISVSAVEGKRSNRQFMDLAAWEMAFAAVRAGHMNSDQNFNSDKFDLASRAAAAPAVLAGLRTSETNLSLLRVVSDRPYSRYPVVYDLDNPWGILLPHLANIKTAVQRLQLQACAELAAGESNKALADVRLSLYLADSLKDEPFLISYLVRIACVQLALQPVWEGLAEHAWSDAQLQELQARFSQYDFIADMKRPLDGERAAGVLTADLLARGKYRLNDLTADPSPPGSTLANLFGRIVPRGWYYQEQLSYCRLFQLQLDGGFDANRRQVFPAQLAADAKALDHAFAGRNPVTTICTRHQLLAVIMLPALNRVPIKAAAAQAAVDEAVIACALERCRQDNGQFPESLGALVPAFSSQLPNDVISGEPYIYHLTSDQPSQSSGSASGQFVLYSVGWDTKDDGGVPGKTLFDEKQGDWVWQYPAR